ncbi:hypothetical protein TrVE_jg5459 [Triparma verrucosa]|uniref:Uncharacterized protein n=1 Tax=Triparma verrucosa TaxID=1606542 RepID=A0A9W7B437_9STRA|nr:hypothetical protein TrVE_jg5459 [Triparma verrucosa]
MKRQYYPISKPGEPDDISERRERLYSRPVAAGPGYQKPNMSRDPHITDLHEFLYKNNCLPDFKNQSKFWCRYTTSGFMEFLVKINFLSHMELRRKSIIIPRSEEEFEAYLVNNVNNNVTYQPSQVKLDKATTIAVQRWLNSFQLWYGDYDGIFDPSLVFALNRFLEREVHGEDYPQQVVGNKMETSSSSNPAKPAKMRHQQVPEPNAVTENVYGAGGSLGTVFYPDVKQTQESQKQGRATEKQQSSLGPDAPIGLLVQKKLKERRERESSSEFKKPAATAAAPVSSTSAPPLAPSNPQTPSPGGVSRGLNTQQPSLAFVWDNVSNYLTPIDIARFSCTSRAMCLAMAQIRQQSAVRTNACEEPGQGAAFVDFQLDDPLKVPQNLGRAGDQNNNSQQSILATVNTTIIPEQVQAVPDRALPGQAPEVNTFEDQDNASQHSLQDDTGSWLDGISFDEDEAGGFTLGGVGNPDDWLDVLKD